MMCQHNVMNRPLCVRHATIVALLLVVGAAVVAASQGIARAVIIRLVTLKKTCGTSLLLLCLCQCAWGVKRCMGWQEACASGRCSTLGMDSASSSRNLHASPPSTHPPTPPPPPPLILQQPSNHKFPQRLQPPNPEHEPQPRHLHRQPPLNRLAARTRRARARRRLAPQTGESDCG